jgi:excisionase family DNA binding protein
MAKPKSRPPAAVAADMPPTRAERRKRTTPHKRGTFRTAPVRRKPSDYLLSTRASCEYLGVSKTTLYQWVADGLITPTRLGPRMLRFDVADLDALLS